MAVTSTLPPQAYTRDTLVKAIEWISTQPLSVRERANSADLVVSFYLQASRRAAHLEAPVSQENFKSDLKHLAEDLRKFEELSPPQQTTAAPIRSPSYGFTEPLVENQRPEMWQPPLRNDSPAPRLEMHTRPEPPPPKNTVWTIDQRSLSVARELQQRLNLGSEVEALRLLVTLGAERARDMFP